MNAMSENPPISPSQASSSEVVSIGCSLVSRCYYYCKNSALRHVISHWRILVLGQILSFLLATTGAAQATLSFDCHLSAPTFTVGCFYFALIFIGLGPLYYEQNIKRWRPIPVTSAADSCDGDEDTVESNGDQQHAGSNGDVTSSNPTHPPYTFLFGRIRIHGPWWMYLIMASIDVYANYFTILAYKYTTITSVTLFDALAIPTAMLMSYLVLQRQFTTLHFLGVLSCSAGIIMNVFQDYEEDEEENASPDTLNDNPSFTTAGTDAAAVVDPAAILPHKLRGDMYALLGGVLFGINNVAGEMAVRNLGGVLEYVGMVGFFASIICTIQASILEQAEIAEFFDANSSDTREETCKESALWWLFGIYFVTSVLSDLGGSYFLQISEATFFNLSLLTGDLWSVIFSIFAEGITPKPLFFIALIFILGGVVVYEMAPSPVAEDRVKEEQQQHHMDDGKDGISRHKYDLTLQTTLSDDEFDDGMMELRQRHSRDGNAGVSSLPNPPIA